MEGFRETASPTASAVSHDMNNVRDSYGGNAPELLF